MPRRRSGRPRRARRPNHGDGLRARRRRTAAVPGGAARTDATARTAPPARPGPPSPSCPALQQDRGQRPAGAEAEPDLLERLHDRVPLAALLGELIEALVGDAVVLAPPLARNRLPVRLHVTEALQPLQQRVQQPLGPVQLATGQLVDPPEDGVAVAFPLG